MATLRQALSPAAVKRLFTETVEHATRRADGSFRKSPEAILGSHPARADHPKVHQDLMRARAAEGMPDMPLATYLRHHASTDVLAYLRAEIGEKALRWAASVDVNELSRLHVDIYKQMLNVMPSYECGQRMSGLYDRLSKSELVQLARKLDRRFPVPVDAPTIFGNLPDFGTARQRAFNHIGFMALNFGKSPEQIVHLGRAEQMLAQGGLAAADLNRLGPPVAGIDLPIRLRDALIMAEHGYPPIVAGRLASETTMRPIANQAKRFAVEAKMQLFSLLDDASVFTRSPEELDALRRELIEAGDVRLSKAPEHADPFGNPFARMNAEDAFKHALNENEAPKVWFNVAEIEHGQGQRIARNFTALSEALNLPEPIRSQFQRLGGLVDPENLTIETPLSHGQADAWAGHSTFHAKKGIYKPNSRRMDKYGNRAVAESESLFSVDAVPEKRRAAAALLISGHPDGARALNGMLGAEPARLTQLIDVFASPEMSKAVAAAPGVRGWLNSLMGPLAAAAQSNGVSADDIARIPKF